MSFFGEPIASDMPDLVTDRIKIRRRVGMKIGVNPRLDAYPGVLGVLESKRAS